MRGFLRKVAWNEMLALMAKQEHMDWFHPRGRWCLVAACPRCGRFLRDTATERLFGRAKLGQWIAQPPRTNGSWLDKSGMCEECLRVRHCDLCGKEGTTSTIYERNDVWGWNRDGRDDYTTESKSALCTSCWNKVRAIVRKQDEADECRRLLSQLTRSISNERKNQNDRRTA